MSSLHVNQQPDGTRTCDDPRTLAAATAAREAVALVRGLVDAGLLDPGFLGSAAAAPAARVPARLRSLVPGQRITVAELAAKAIDSCTGDTRRTYAGYMRLLAHGWPERAPEDEKLFPGLGSTWWDEVLASDLEQALRFVEQRALLHAHWRAENRAAAGRVPRQSDASGAKYNAVGAWRRMGKVAVSDRHLAHGFDPSQELTKPKRSKGSRHALPEERIDELLLFVGSTGDDPQLDLLLAETILITGARQEGILNLQLSGIDLDECTVRLDEKFGKVVAQPVPDFFAQRLHDFAVARGCLHYSDPVFRKRTSSGEYRPITERRFNYFADRVQAAFEWADREQVVAHTLRHQAITRVERKAGKAVSTAFARHEPEDTNAGYGKATREEVAEAVVALYGGSHPWARKAGSSDPL